MSQFKHNTSKCIYAFDVALSDITSVRCISGSYKCISSRLFWVNSFAV